MDLDLNPLKLFNNRRMRALLVVLGVSLGAAALSKNPWSQGAHRYSLGEIALRDEIASKNIRIIDEFLTNQNRQEAAAQSQWIFDFDSDARKETLARLEQIQKRFALTREFRNRQWLSDQLQIQLTDLQWQALQEPTNLRTFLGLIRRVIQSINGLWIIEKQVSPESSDVIVRDLANDREEVFSREQFQQKILSLDNLNERIHKIIAASSRQIDKMGLKNDELTQLLMQVMRPDLSYNKIESDQRRSDAVEKIDPFVLEAKEGEVILKVGEPADRRHLLLLGASTKSQSLLSRLQTTALITLFLFVLILILYEVGRSNFRKFKMTFRDQWVIGLFLVSSLGVYAFGIHLLTSARDATSFGPALIYLLPLAFSGMTLRLFTSMEITHFFILIQAICLALLQENAFFGVVFYATSLSAAARMRHIAQRAHVFRAGFAAGVVKMILTLIGVSAGLLYMPDLGFAPFSYTTIVLFCLMSGALSSMLVLGLQPVLELVGYTTDLRLMELASTNHPLLRDLILKAPGTYFHSFTVSQLAEKAAEAIHGNGLFARVASLYHDVGKVSKPHYFIENIKGENKHDKLAPTMSALIISNHVKEGIDLALEHKLPPSIIEVIPQHHGTALISYFYDKAQKLAEVEGTEPPDDRDFRYPGPRPQTREGAIILLADAVEATVKSLPKKSPDQMRQVVHQTIQRFFLDGQLDECDLTLKDLNAIAMAFLQVLQGVYHQRIEYPSQKEDAEENNRVSALRPRNS